MEVYILYTLFRTLLRLLTNFVCVRAASNWTILIFYKYCSIPIIYRSCLLSFTCINSGWRKTVTKYNTQFDTIQFVRAFSTTVLNNQIQIYRSQLIAYLKDLCQGRDTQKGNDILLPKRQKKNWGSPTSFWREHSPKNTLNLKNRASLADRATVSVSPKMLQLDLWIEMFSAKYSLIGPIKWI